MSLFSSLRKNKQESTSSDSEFHSRAEEESAAVRGRGKRRQGKPSAVPADPVLPEKKRARRRLVGAVALVLAAVIGLPMVLDSEPKPLADDIAIQIPSQDQMLPPAAMRKPTSNASQVAASDTLDEKEEMLDAPIATATSVVPNTQRDDSVLAKVDKSVGTKLPDGEKSPPPRLIPMMPTRS